MTTAEFFHECERHDWYAIFSDDYRWERAADEGMKKLEALAKENPTFAMILDDWRKFKFSGPNFSREQSPEPKVSDYL